MGHRDFELDLVVDNAKQLVERIAIAKQQYHKQKVSVKVQHLPELEHLYKCCAEFQRYIDEVEEAEEAHRQPDYAAAEMAWNQSMDAVDILLKSLA